MSERCEHKLPDGRVVSRLREGCGLCARDARAAGRPARPRRQTLPCFFLGEPLTGREREAAGLPHNRDWRHCGHSDKPLGPHVCTCKGCGRGCPGFVSVGGKKAVLITGGIGDALTVEGMLRPEERDQIETIYYACKSWRIIASVFQALPNYPLLRNHIALPSGKTTYYEKAGVEKALGPLPDVEDLSILTVFPKERPFVSSSPLLHRLATPQPIEDGYAVVVPRSRGFGGWSDRDFSEADWRTCLAALARTGLRGVVLTESREAIPASEWLLDLQGKTTLPESIEILKGARGYLGIDSCLSVLASKLFPPSRLSVKSVSAHLHKWQHHYYAPRAEFGFVSRVLKGWD